jgi:hypothetical protein
VQRQRPQRRQRAAPRRRQGRPRRRAVRAVASFTNHLRPEAEHTDSPANEPWYTLWLTHPDGG